MCGLVGYIGTTTHSVDMTFIDMLQMNVVRGCDSTGAAFVSAHGGEILLLKDAVLPQDLIYTPDFKSAINRSNRTLIGHNRWATKGDITKENAHPFTIGKITGTHNGTLVSTHNLPDHTKFATDSECIFNAIDQIGIDKTWALLHGAAALVWWNSEEESLNLLTNEQRPLHFAHVKKPSGLFWASEPWTISAAAGRDNRDFDMEKIYFCRKNWLRTIKFVNNEIVETARELKPYTIPVHIHEHGWYGADFSRGPKFPYKHQLPIKYPKTEVLKVKSVNGTEEVEVLKETPLKTALDKATKKALKLFKTKHVMRGFKGQLLNQVDFEAWYRNCCFCGTSLWWGDLGMEFYSNTMAACSQCAEQANLYNITP